MKNDDRVAQRRQLLKWLSASPLLGAGGSAPLWAQELGREMTRNVAKRPDPMIWKIGRAHV